MKRADEEVCNEYLQQLQKITLECYACQRYAKKPLRYTAVIPGDISFNHEIVVEIMTINRMYVLQISDIGTRFSAAKCITEKLAETLWNTFLPISALPYTGVAHIVP